MKKIVFVLCLVSSAAALAQNFIGGSAMNNQPQAYSFPEHPLHAAYAAMAQERGILSATPYFSEHGDRRPSDFAQPEAVSLGTIARELRKEHADVKKSRVVWINQ